MCLCRDGAVFACDTMESLLQIREDCARIGAELGIGIVVKQWEQLSHMEDESGMQSEIRELLIKQKARTGSALSNLPGRNMCLYNAAKFLDMPGCITLI